MKELKFREWTPSLGMSYNPMVGVFYDAPLQSAFNNRTLMQYIGKPFGSNTEIYNGDIVAVHQFLFDGNEIEKEWIAEVVYIEDVCGFGLKVISGEFALSHTGYDSYEEMPPFAFSEVYGLHEESFKVIGNIHENPKLKT